MYTIYNVYNEFDDYVTSFLNKEDADAYINIFLKDGYTSKVNCYESLSELVKKNPEKYIKMCKEKLNHIENGSVKINGFKNKDGVIGSYKLKVSELKEIVKDGPENLTKHVSGFFYNEEPTMFDVTKKDFHLFEKAYNKIIKQYTSITKFINKLEFLTEKKTLIKKTLIMK